MVMHGWVNNTKKRELSTTHGKSGVRSSETGDGT